MDTFIKKFKEKRPGLFPIAPGDDIKLGDYGYLKDGFFIREGNITDDFEIDLTNNIQENDIYTPIQDFEVKHRSSVELASSAIVHTNNVFTSQVNVRFTDKNSFYYHTRFKSRSHIKSPRRLKNDIMDLYKNNNWKKKYVLVTTVIKSDNMLRIFSAEAGITALINCETNYKVTTLTDVRCGAEVKYKKTSSDVDLFTAQGTENGVIAFELFKITGLFDKNFERYAGTHGYGIPANNANNGSISYKEYLAEDDNEYNEDTDYSFVKIL